MSDLQPGERIGPYEIRGLLGEGGMGAVYLAEDHSLGRRVALKMLPRKFLQDPDIVTRFQREARALAKLRHPNLMHIYTVGEHEGRPYFAMEYIKGSTLSSLIARTGHLPPEQAAHIAGEVLAALDKVHKAGIIHRDVKSGNILLDEDGRAVLMDFGLARQQADVGLTADHTVLGTPSYMSPEQARGEALDARTDLYSLGVVLYEMLTGSVPFQGKSSFEILRQHIESSVPPPSAVHPDVPPGLDLVVAKATAKSRDDRYADVAEMAADLAAVYPHATLLRLVDGPRPATEPTVLRARAGFASTVRLEHTVPSRGPRRGRRWQWVGLAAALLALAFVAWLVLRPAPDSWVEFRPREGRPVRGRLIRLEVLDDGTTTVKIRAEGSEEPKGFRVGDGDQLIFLDHR